MELTLFLISYHGTLSLVQRGDGDRSEAGHLWTYSHIQYLSLDLR